MKIRHISTKFCEKSVSCPKLWNGVHARTCVCTHKPTCIQSMVISWAYFFLFAKEIGWYRKMKLVRYVCVCVCVCIANRKYFFFSNCGWFGHSYETRSQLKMSLIWPRWGFEFDFRMNRFLSLTRSVTLCSSWAQTLAILLKQSILLRNIRCVMTVLSEFSFVVLADELFHMKEVKNC